tara:strand:+ start:585 stop:779 length:195 start_codon:yes stop_codon:yes gene_type:complete
LNKGTQYNDLSKAAAKEAKELKMNLQKYDLIKSEDNIQPIPNLKDCKNQDERIMKVCSECVDTL